MREGRSSAGAARRDVGAWPREYRVDDTEKRNGRPWSLRLVPGPGPEDRRDPETKPAGKRTGVVLIGSPEWSMPGEITGRAVDN